MDEDSRPDLGGRRAEPVVKKASHHVEIHRVNDLLLGHIGQVSYKPAEDEEEGVGDLHCNRVTDQPPSLQQVLPFQELLPPTRTNVPLPPTTNFQRMRSQQRWLLKEHPEAFLGNLDLYSMVSEETRLLDSQNRRNWAGATLAVGEIHDLHNSRSSHSTGSPAIALAAGEAGHMLRVYALTAEQWGWRESILAVGALQPNFHGSWCRDGTAISKLQFATKLKQYDNIRWLIAQKETSTTIFEPAIRAKVVHSAGTATDQHLGTSGHIAMNAVVTLAASATGGTSHCDFSVNMGQDEDFPQLAIIDSSGNWSVWLIARDGHGRSRKTKATLRKKGGWTLPLHVPLDGGFLTPMPRITWTSSVNGGDAWERDSNPPNEVGQTPQSLNSAYLTGTHAAHMRYDKLAMCNNTQFQVLDPLGGDTNPAWLDFFRRDGADMPLDAQTFSGSPSHVLVLTTDRLYLLDVTVAEGQVHGTPAILVSCLHFRHDHRDLLKMTVSPLRSSHDRTSALVLLHSTENLRVSLFWFNISHQNSSAQLHHQVMQLSGLEANNVDKKQGIACLVAVPLQVAARGQGHPPNPQTEGHSSNQVAKNEAQFFQLFGLSADLRLNVSMVVVAPEPLDDPPRRTKQPGRDYKKATRSKVLRKAELQQAELAFVLPDEVGTDKKSTEIQKSANAEKHDVLQLRFYFLKIMQEINDAYFGNDQPNALADHIIVPIRQATQDRDEMGHISLRSFMSYSGLWLPLDLQKLEDEWERGLRQLTKINGMTLVDCGSYGSKQSVLDVLEKISISWSARLSPESLKTSQWSIMELALERMAAEVFLSERGLCVVPQATLSLALKAGSCIQVATEAEEEVDRYHSRSSQLSFPTPTPPATPSSAQPTPAPSTGDDEGDDDEAGLEDPAVARLRMYLPSIRFTPRVKDGTSRILSLWPDQRGADPTQYQYEPFGKKGLSEAAQRRKQRDEERQQRKAMRIARLGLKAEGPGGSFSQPAQGVVHSSPPPMVRHAMEGSSSQSFGFGLGSSQVGSASQSQSFSQGFGFSQTMSQPVPGEFGARSLRLRKKAKPKARKGFK